MFLVKGTSELGADIRNENTSRNTKGELLIKWRLQDGSKRVGKEGLMAPPSYHVHLRFSFSTPGS